MSIKDETLVLLTPKETARRLSISTTALRWQVNNGKFPAPRWIGSVMRFLASDVVTYAYDLPTAEIDYRGFPDEEKPKRDTAYAKAQLEAKFRDHMKAQEPLRRAAEAADRQRAAKLQEQEDLCNQIWEPRRNRDPKAPLPLP